MQVGGSYLGMMCGGGVFLMLSAASGWPVAMLMMAVLIMALSLPLWRITEPTRTATIPHVPALGYALRRKQARLGLLLVLMLNSGMRFVLPLLAPLLLDHGLSMSALGALFSGGNIAAGIAGTLAGGLLMKYTSPGRALLTLSLIHIYNRNQAIELFRRQAANIDAANRNLPLLRIGIAH